MNLLYMLRLLELYSNNCYKSVVVLGHDKYYSKFGFKPESIWGIKEYTLKNLNNGALIEK